MNTPERVHGKVFDATTRIRMGVPIALDTVGERDNASGIAKRSTPTRGSPLIGRA
jgi:hypothetical protein